MQRKKQAGIKELPLAEKKGYVLWLVIIMVIIVTLCITIFRLGTFIKNINGIEDEKYEIEKLKAELANLRIIEDRAEDINTLLENYKKTIPDYPGENSIITDIESVARKRNIEIRQIQFGEHVTGKNTAKLTQIPFDLYLTGSYPALVSFIEDVSNNPRVIVISSINIKRNDEVSGELLINISLNSFYKK